MEELPLRLVTVDNFYASMESPLAPDLLGGLGRLRARGYGPDYPASYLSLDAADFVCTHHLFCVEREGRLTPVGGYRAVSLLRLDQYGLALPLLKTAEDSGSVPHVEALTDLIAGARREGTDVVYCASFTIEKSMRADKALSGTAKELLAGIHWLESQTCPPAIHISAGVLRFKVGAFYRDVGYFPMTHEDEVLPPLKKKSASGELIQLLRQEYTSPWCRECFERHRAIFDARLVIAPASVHPVAANGGAVHELRA